MKKTHGIFLAGIIIAFVCRGEFQYTNQVDWASAPSVIGYLDALLVEKGSSCNVEDSDLTNIVVSAIDIWRECLNFNVDTNQYQQSAEMLRLREKELFVIMRMQPVLKSHSGYAAATNCLARLKPMKDIGRGRPLPRPLLNIAHVATNATERDLCQIAAINTARSNSYHSALASYRRDQQKREFYLALFSFYSTLDFMTRNL